jgi:hypothetical protein
MNTSGDPSTWDFHLQNGSPCIDSGTFVNAPEQDIEGNPRPGGDGKVCIGAYESPDHYTRSTPQPPSRIYVSKSGNNTNGDSWEDAYTSITTALSFIGDNLYEIWVAEGTYLEGDTIQVPGCVHLYGGFAGTESLLEERNISENPTIIDGENSYRCVYNYGTIDGFYVINGYAHNSDGGGICNDNGTVANCSLFSNSADGNGGGIDNTYGTVTNCILYSNSSNYYGGGIRNWEGTVTSCTLYSNSALWEGGGIWNCGFISNSIIQFNNAESSGGGIYNAYSSMSIIYNCFICSNSGLGIYNNYGGVHNCTLFNNDDGIYNYNNGIVMNCISWQNKGSDIKGGTVYYTCFKESDGTNANINADPMFIKVDGNVSSWIYQVKNGSPCIDAGNPDESYNDGCQPPGKGGVRCDMGAYGGLYNCNWGVNITQDDLIDFLTGKKTLYNLQFPFADRNSDDKVDIADLISFVSQLNR